MFPTSPNRMFDATLEDNLFGGARSKENIRKVGNDIDFNFKS